MQIKVTHGAILMRITISLPSTLDSIKEFPFINVERQNVSTHFGVFNFLQDSISWNNRAAISIL